MSQALFATVVFNDVRKNVTIQQKSPTDNVSINYEQVNKSCYSACFCAELWWEMFECTWVCVLQSVSILITTMSNNSSDPPPAAHISRVCKQDVDPSNIQLF